MRDEAHLARDVDDAAAALRAHRRQHRLAREKRRAHVDGDQLVELRRRVFAERMPDADARVVDEHVDAAERLNRRGDHACGRFGVREIENAAAPAARRVFPAAFRSRGFELRRRLVRDEVHVRTCFSETHAPLHGRFRATLRSR